MFALKYGGSSIGKYQDNLIPNRVKSARKLKADVGLKPKGLRKNFILQED